MGVSKWLSLTAFMWTADIVVHIVHVIIAYILEYWTEMYFKIFSLLLQFAMKVISTEDTDGWVIELQGISSLSADNTQ